MFHFFISSTVHTLLEINHEKLLRIYIFIFLSEIILLFSLKIGNLNGKVIILMLGFFQIFFHLMIST